MSGFKCRAVRLALCVSVACSLGVNVQAKEQLTLEEVLVMARGIEEPVRKVPFGLSVFSAGDIEHKAIMSSGDLFRKVPNFNYTNSGLPEANLINIRGTGSSSTFLSPSVTYYIDGVPVPQRAFDLEFLDIERIEVLRGPQGTLFGQNSQAGAVNIITRSAEEKRAHLGAEYGSFAQTRLSTSAAGALSEGLSGSLQARHLSRDGDIENVTFDAMGGSRSEDSIRKRKNTSISGKLAFAPSDETRVEFSVRWQSDDRHPTTGLLLDAPEPKNALGPIPDNELESLGSALTVTHSFSDIKFVSISGFESYDLVMRADITDGFIGAAGSPAPAFMFAPENSLRKIDEDNDQISQELRLSAQNENISWVAGVSFLSSDFDSSTDITSPFLSNGQYSANIERENIAVFGELTKSLSERISMIGGVRVTEENQDFMGVFIGRTGGAPAIGEFSEGGDTSDTLTTGRVALRFDVSDDLTAYMSIARGAKAGGFPFYNQSAAFSISLQEFESSSTLAYEVGLKGNLGSALSFSSALFLNNTSDEQLFIFNPIAAQFQVENADTSAYGLELEASASLGSYFALNTSLALTSAEAEEDNGASVREGNKVPYTPELSGSLGLEFTRPLKLGSEAGQLRATADYEYVGARQIDPANSKELDSYGLVNLNIRYELEHWAIHAYLNNVFDEDYTHSGFAAGMRPEGGRVFGGVPGEPRMAGLGVSFNF